MLRQCLSYYITNRNLQIVTHSRRSLSCSSYSLSSNSKRRSLLQTGQCTQKKDSGPKFASNELQLLEPSTSKIVQLRPVTSNTYPFIQNVKDNSSSQFAHASTTCPPPPPTCPPPFQPNCPPSQPPCPPPPCPPPKPNNTLRNVLIGLLAGGAAIGGLYYAFGDNTRPDLLPADKKSKESPRREVVRKPANRDDFPRKVPYILIGGGTASFAAFRAIKSREPDARVLVISAEDALPYMRPPLSKEIWYQKDLAQSNKLVFRQWNGQERSIFYEPSEFYTDLSELLTSPHGGVSIATGWVVSKVDPSAHVVELDDPVTNTRFGICYDKCLIATGSRPKNLPIFEQANPLVKKKVVLYRNLQDLENLWATLDGVRSVVIVGGGFLGSELACALANRYKGSSLKIQQVFKESGNMGHVLPGYLAEWTTEKVREEGVKVTTEVEVKEVDMYNNEVVLTLSNESCVKADVVIVAVGSEPNIQLADTSSLEVHESQGGFLVNAELEARTDLYVAGDAACFYDPTLGRRRVEHHDHAVVSGRLAGENMTGAAKAYKHQSMFWSDLGHDVGYEAIGIVDSCLPTVAVFAKGKPGKSADRLSVGTQESGTVTSAVSEPKVGVDKSADDSYTETEKHSNENTTKAEEHSTTKIEDTKTSTNLDNNELEPLPKTGITLECKDVTNKACGNRDYNKGIIFYLKDDMVVGIVLWNVFNRMHIARQVLAEKRKYDDLNEVAKLFKIHEEED